eukprot:Nitzschia sp. Nitz4//scaffold182_size44100//35180//37282//NITZ4_007260-RA/size44100-exonerate_est2genome-gene-0.64-mRNA-1//1//CDS//3329539583//4249//frame0
MAKIKLIVMGFASHITWAEGFKAATQQHVVEIVVVPGDRWKFRLMASAAELESKIELDDDIVVVDGMLDVTVLVALLKSNRLPDVCPKILQFFHENQLTTPFSSQDRDVQRNTHWHYGMAHWRSLQVCDGFIFNSQTQLDDFARALPKAINEQCPRDVVEWHLSKCQELLRDRCTFLHYGLALDQLKSGEMPDPSTKVIPTILWNARLEEDKDPQCFIDVLHQVVKQDSSPFRLIVLGKDSTSDQRWIRQIRKEFPLQLWHLGWCSDRSEYAQWLNRASIVVSTAKHETFGISMVESAYCGALPVLPMRLSYPEIFPFDQFQNHFFKDDADCVQRILSWLNLVRNGSPELLEAMRQITKAASRFCWDEMGYEYDSFFTSLENGQPIAEARHNASTANDPPNRNQDIPTAEILKIEDAADARIQLYRPKSLRHHREYNRQIQEIRASGLSPAIHGGRRAMVRMLEAKSFGANIQVLSFLSTSELANKVCGDGSRCPDTPIYVADKDLISDIRGQKLNTGDSILSVVHFPVESSLEELVAQPPILILDDVRNAENVGSILRTAFCLGITSVIASRTTWAALRDSRAARCSMGTMYYLKYYQAFVLPETISELERGGIHVYGVEIGEDACPVSPHRAGDTWAAVLGNEDAGLDQSTRKACSSIVFVPQARGDSLNVGHAAAITMFELGGRGAKVRHNGWGACV